ncbi:hypothetical protein F2Q69_00014374 [Brassica cretica]|uniref:Uncharacterized protein n=1 Tax=Brassica cretica TaxID=69181 RepID=A0A8S9R3Y9_BRACR|nr:hypothetical protein F2Q69_00014374 [Brassica cretica]
MERFGVFRRIAVQEEMESEHWSRWSKPTRGRDHGMAYPRSPNKKSSRREVEDAGSWTRAHEPRRQSDAGWSTRGNLPAHDRDARRRSDAGWSTRGLLPARMMRHLATIRCGLKRRGLGPMNFTRVATLP